VAAGVVASRGAGVAVLTLGPRGALYHDGAQTVHVPAVSAGAVAETTAPGDAFNGGFAAAPAEGRDPVAAIRFSAATAGVSVTRFGAAASMPSPTEIEAFLAKWG